MNVLLDTCVYLWWLADHPRLKKQTKTRIMQAETAYVSAISLFEAAIKIQLGKLTVVMEDLITGIEKSGFELLTLLPQHAKTLVDLPKHHGDPFDRMLIAQAISEPLIFITADAGLTVYSSRVCLQSCGE